MIDCTHIVTFWTCPVKVFQLKLVYFTFKFCIFWSGRFVESNKEKGVVGLSSFLVQTITLYMNITLLIIAVKNVTPKVLRNYAP